MAAGITMNSENGGEQLASGQPFPLSVSCFSLAVRYENSMAVPVRNVSKLSVKSPRVSCLHRESMSIQVLWNEQT